MEKKIFKWKYLIIGEWILAVILAVPTLGIGFVIFAVRAIYHQYLLKDEIEFTNDKIIHRKKFITESSFEDYFKNVVEYDIKTKNNFWEALFGAINISLICYIKRGIDTQRPEITTYRIDKKDYQKFKDELEDLMAKKR